MMDARPAPFVPAGCDLRSFPYIQIDILRLFGSEFHAIATDGEWRAGFTLWCKAYHQVPAGSLPRDDAALVRLAELGRDRAEWEKVKAVALRGWVECSDGRLYHSVVAEKVLEAFLERLVSRRRGITGNAERWKKTADTGEVDTDIATVASLLKIHNPSSQQLVRHAGLLKEVSFLSQDDAEAIEEQSSKDRGRIEEGSQDDRGRIEEQSSEDRKLSEAKLRSLSSSLCSEERGPAQHENQDPPANVVHLHDPVKPRRRVARRPETEWPEDLVFDDELRQVAEAKGFLARRADLLWESFQSKSKSKAWRYTDWRQAWRNFVIKEIQFSGDPRATAPPRRRVPDV